MASFWRPRVWVWVPVVVASLVMARLGFWQLSRLAQRRAANARAWQQWQAPRVDLNLMPWPADPAAWDLRAAEARGVWDHARTFVVKNRVFRGQTGLHLITPLRLDGVARPLLVVRGWLPPEQDDPAVWDAYQEVGPVTVRGRLFLFTPPPRGAGVATPQASAAFPRVWYHLDWIALQAYLGPDLAPWYLVAEPDAQTDPSRPPYRERLTLTLDDGPHLGYALQWFCFAAALPALVWWRQQRGASPARGGGPALRRPQAANEAGTRTPQAPA